MPLRISLQLQPVFRDLTMQAVASTEIHVHMNIIVFPVFFCSERKTTQVSINVPEEQNALPCAWRDQLCTADKLGAKSKFWVMQNLFLLCSKLLKSLAEYTLSTPFSFPKHLRKECLLIFILFNKAPVQTADHMKSMNKEMK